MTETTIALSIPSDLAAALRSRGGEGSGMEEQLKVSLAIGLFAEGRISLGKAAALAGRSRLEFARVLQRAGLAAVTYTETDLAEDRAFLDATMEI